ncbi:MAG: class II fructose-bisphosphate aldolase [Eubacteriales bacterium]
MYERVDKILKMAEKSNTSVISFVCMDFIMARTVAKAAEATNTPAIIMLYPTHIAIRQAGTKQGYAAAAKDLANEVKVPIGLHMDHDFSYDAVKDSINKGFDSVMMDASMNDLEENIRLTREVVDMAHKMNVVVEGELGHVGMAAKDDNKDEDLFTNPDMASRFCKETNVDALAISIGNAHGKYSATPNLDMKRLEDIRIATNTPLVLHGGSGIPDDQLLEAFSKGIRKFNLGTEYMGEYFKVLSGYTEQYKDDENPIKITEMPIYVQTQLQPYVENRLKVLCKF